MSEEKAPSDNAVLKALLDRSGATANVTLKRGRPKRDPYDATVRALRRQAFGKKLRDLREQEGLSLAEVARRIGFGARKLNQYETTCYPPGEAIIRLAPHYGVSREEMGDLVLSHSDPDLYEAITGRPGYQPDEHDIALALPREKQTA